MVSAMLLLGTCATSLPVSAKNSLTTPTSMPATKPVATTEVNLLVSRLYEIKEMDTSTLSFSEKRALRSEVRSIEKEMNRRGGGLYISVGGAILIILIIIILL